jgi:hypothetical protein
LSSVVTPGLALAFLVLAIVFGITSCILLRQIPSEDHGEEVRPMTAKNWFRDVASATALALSAVSTNFAATAALG